MTRWRWLFLVSSPSGVACELLDTHNVDDCRCWAGKGDCATNTQFMHSACAATCDKTEKAIACEKELTTCTSEAASSGEQNKRKAELEAELAQLKVAEQGRAEAMTVDAAKISELQKKLEESELRISEVDLREEELVQAQLAKKSLQEDLDALRKSSGDGEKTATHIATLEQELAQSKSDEESLRSRLAEHDAASISLKERMSVLESQLEHAKSAEQEKGSQFDKEASKALEFQERVTILEDNLARSRSAEQDLQRQLETHRTDAAVHGSANDENSERIAALQQEVAQKTSAANDLERQLNTQKDEVANSVVEGNALKEQVSALQSELEAAKSAEQSKKTQSEIEAANVAQLQQQIETQTQEAAKTTTENVRMTERIVALEEDVARAKSAESDSQRRLEEHRGSAVAATAACDGDSERIAALERDMAQRRSMEEDLRKDLLAKQEESSAFSAERNGLTEQISQLNLSLERAESAERERKAELDVQMAGLAKQAGDQTEGSDVMARVKALEQELSRAQSAEQLLQKRLDERENDAAAASAADDGEDGLAERIASLKSELRHGASSTPGEASHAQPRSAHRTPGEASMSLQHMLIAPRLRLASLLNTWCGEACIAAADDISPAMDAAWLSARATAAPFMAKVAPYIAEVQAKAAPVVEKAHSQAAHWSSEARSAALESWLAAVMHAIPLVEQAAHRSRTTAVVIRDGVHSVGHPGSTVLTLLLAVAALGVALVLGRLLIAVLLWAGSLALSAAFCMVELLIYAAVLLLWPFWAPIWSCCGLCCCRERRRNSAIEFTRAAVRGKALQSYRGPIWL